MDAAGGQKTGGRGRVTRHRRARMGEQQQQQRRREQMAELVREFWAAQGWVRRGQRDGVAAGVAAAEKVALYGPTCALCTPRGRR